MSTDYYKTLGVEKNSTKEDIKKAFRKKAHEYHPDKKTGDEKKFKEVNEAYSILSDDKKRAQYDQFGSAAFNGGQPGGGQGFGGFDFSGFTGANGQNIEFDMNDILGSFFGGGRQRVRKGNDLAIDVELEFNESIFGVKKKIKLPNKSSGEGEFEVSIPAGIDNGEMIRMTGKGEGVEGGRPGDLYIRIHVKGHKKMRKEGIHLVMDEKIKLTQAISGGKIKINVLEEDGEKELTLKIPAGINHGEILKVREKGVMTMGGRRGDLLVQVLIDMPGKLSKKAKEALKVLEGEGV